MPIMDGITASEKILEIVKNNECKPRNISNENLRIQEPWIKEEFIDRMAYVKEFNTEIFPDLDTMQNRSFHGLLFSVY